MQQDCTQDCQLFQLQAGALQLMGGVRQVATASKQIILECPLAPSQLAKRKRRRRDYPQSAVTLFTVCLPCSWLPLTWVAQQWRTRRS